MAALQCQSCRTPLRVDGSLQDLNPASFKILADAAPALEPKAPLPSRSAAARERREQYDEVASQVGQPAPRRNTSGAQRYGGKNAQPDMSYIMLSESQIGTGKQDDVLTTPTKRRPSSTKTALASDSGNEKLSEQMETTMRLFEILSARSDIDHPVCSECTDLLLDSLRRRQDSVIRERDAYVQFLKQAQDDVPSEEARLKAKKDLEAAQQTEQKALGELETLEAEKARMEDEIAALDREAEALEEEEEQFWRERNAFTIEMTGLQEERDSLQNQLAHDSKLLESLQRTNVYNDTFCIAHDGNFATINGLRLGRLADHPVEWSEINAALGQAVLLLCIVSEKLDYRFKNHKLVPVGSTSKIIVETRQPQSNDVRQKTHELHSSGDLPLGLGGLFQGKFDNAMVEFLACLRELGDHVHRNPRDTVKKMPYIIDKDKINDVSIKLSYGHEEQWTRACKYMLTCCKFLLAHASHVDDSRRAGR